MLHKILRRFRLAYQRTAKNQILSTNIISTFLFFLFGNKQRLGRFKLGALIFFARLSDWVAVDEVAVRGEYNFVNPLIIGKSTPIVMDLGANIGMFSLFVFSQNPTAIIYAVEPSDATFQILERNRRANPSLNWYTYWAALWDEPGKINFADNAMASTASYVSADSGNKQVSAMCLSDLMDEIDSNIDLIKMDIEGAEERVLYQSKQLLDKVDTLVVELHPDRCSQPRVVQLLLETFDHLYQVGHRSSAKPLLIASRTVWDLPVYSAFS